MNTAKQTTETILLTSEASRSDDRRFIIEYLITLGIKLTPEAERRILNGYSFETLTRERRQIQNKEKKLQATPEVQKIRSKREVEMQSKYAHGTWVYENDHARWVEGGLI